MALETAGGSAELIVKDLLILLASFKRSCDGENLDEQGHMAIRIYQHVAVVVTARQVHPIQLFF